MIPIEDGRTPRILFVSPHLSTGGLPQYLWKKIEMMNLFYEVHCVEYSWYGPAYVVQRNKIESLLGDRFYAIGSDGQALEDVINRIQPDIVHFEELSETFVDQESLARIYSDNRSYLIYETCHSSVTSPHVKKFLPDKFVMVSDWIAKKFSIWEVPILVLEYPVEDLKPDRQKAMEILGLDPSRKHVINVGLFTEGKNQGELFNYARSMVDFPIDFHFIGNQAVNFSWYWEPLMKSIPSNCKIWGERNDVDLFYQIADLFVFTSKMELNPICLKESLSWKNKILMRNLETYSGSYDKNPNVSFLTDNLKENALNILQLLGFVKNMEPDDSK